MIMMLQRPQLLVVALAACLGFSVAARQITFVGSILDQLTDPLAKIDPAFGHSSPLALSSAAIDTSLDRQISEIPANGPIPNFEINKPPSFLPDEQGLQNCTIELETRSFANSYGQPSVFKYSPSAFPSSCSDPSKWRGLVLMMNGTSQGRQFDRLGSVFLESAELWRTDNPEPTLRGVVWETSKQVDQYYDLLRKDGTMVFDFPNIVDNTYTGILNITLSLVVYTAAAEVTTGKGKPKTPSLLSSRTPIIVPLSNGNVTANSNFVVGEGAAPNAGSTSVRFPRNAAKAIVEIYASGTATDEFWYTNIPDDFYADTPGSAAGYYPRGPFRQVSLLIDNHIAGVVLPYATIFTGGIAPTLWRPSVAFGAYDQRTYLLDITPFIGVLTDDKEHTFQLQVTSSGGRNHTIDASWFISGNVQIVLDKSSERTTGRILNIAGGKYANVISTGRVHGNVSTNGTLDTLVQAAPRFLRIDALLKTGSQAIEQPISVTHSFNYQNKGKIDGATGQYTDQTASGSSASQHGLVQFMSSSYSYPLYVALTGDSTSLNATVNHQFKRSTVIADKRFALPRSSHVDVTQKGVSHLIVQNNTLIGGTGNQTTTYSYDDSDGYSFDRSISIANYTINYDKVSGTLGSQAPPPSAAGGHKSTHRRHLQPFQARDYLLGH